MSRKKPAKRAAKETATPGLQPFSRMVFVRVALGVALAISAFLAWESFRSSGVPGCGPESGCDRVLNSRWARLFGVSVTIPALAVYAVLLAQTFAKQIRWQIISFLSAIVLASVLWFVALQIFVVRAFCPYCLAAHFAGFTGAAMLLAHRTRSTVNPALLGASAVAAFALAQTISPAPPPTQVRTAEPPGTGVTTMSVRIFPILGGQFQLDLSSVPVSGGPAGSNRVVKLFDYTCHHCRELHHLLHRYKQTNQLTLVSLPMALDPACNPVMTRAHPDHADACEYARTGLAVFLARPEKFEQFSDWLFEPARPAPLQTAQVYAATLVGSNEFTVALRDPRIEQQLKTNIAIYIASSQRARNSRIPQLIFENSASIGPVADLAQLHQVIRANLGATNGVK